MTKTKASLIIGGIILVVGLALMIPDNTGGQSVEEVRKEAYDYAVKCAEIDSPRVKFEDIQWVSMPGSHFKIQAEDGSAYFLGWTDVKDSAIYVAETEQETFWVNSHEVLHVLGFINHPYFPFRTCGLMEDQNR